MATDTTLNKPIILIICNYYLPGYKAGGGLRTLAHMVERFGEKFDFRVITRNHDLDEIPYTEVKSNEWNEVAETPVFYLSKENIKFWKLRRLIAETNPQLIYLNSVFSTLTVLLLLLRRFNLIPDVPVVLAPEGEISDGALNLKAKKKRSFMTFARRLNLYRNLIWKATAEPEKMESERFKGTGGEVYIAPNMPSKSIFEEYQQELKPKKKSGEAKMIFLSRYMRKKNFKWLVDILNVQGNLEIDIYGPIEDETYWNETQSAIKKLPSNIEINYKGIVSHEEVLETLFNYHFFVLPTVSENFGHVFVEALAAGCPLVISDQTPWVDLESKGIGWDLSLTEPEKWIDSINYCINLDNDAYSKMSANCRQFACRWLKDPSIAESTLRVLERGLSYKSNNKR